MDLKLWDPLLAPALEKIPNLYAVIWTTTPWTIPANRAIAVNPELRYSVVMAGQDHYLVATDRVDAFRQDIGYSEPMETVHECLGAELVGSTYRHILTNAESPIIAGAHVTSESGTGLVHTAPDHGMEDYEVCQALGIKPFGPVDDQGRYTKEVGEKLAGLDAFTTGTAAVIDALKESNAILKEEQYAHKYPYDWRTKKPVMLRATAQWFANVEDLQKTAVEALKSVRMVPEVCKFSYWTLCHLACDEKKNSNHFFFLVSHSSIRTIYTVSKGMVHFTTAGVGSPDPGVV